MKKCDLLIVLAVGIICQCLYEYNQKNQSQANLEINRLKRQELDSVFRVLDFNGRREVLKALKKSPDSRIGEIALGLTNSKINGVQRAQTALRHQALQEYNLCNVFTQSEYDSIAQDINSRVSNNPTPLTGYLFDMWGDGWYLLDFHSGNLEDLILVVDRLHFIEGQTKLDTIRIPQEKPLITAWGDIVKEDITFTTPKVQKLYEQFIRRFDYMDSLCIWNNPEYRSRDSAYRAAIDNALEDKEKLRRIKYMFDYEINNAKNKYVDLFPMAHK